MSRPDTDTAASPVVAIIPARLASTRLPNKVLQPIGGKPMIQWVYAAAAATPGIDRVYVATAAPAVERTCRGFGAEVITTGADHPTGTDRVAFAARGLDAAVVINVQADEPTLTPGVLAALVAAFADPAVHIASLMTRAAAAELSDPDVVKVVCAANGDALYFSRSAIPFGRDPGAQAASARVHLGVYGFRAEMLQRFAAAEPSPLERAESLEQLRALHHGWPIRMVEVDWRGVGVDTAADLARARELLAGKRPADGTGTLDGIKDE